MTETDHSWASAIIFTMLNPRPVPFPRGIPGVEHHRAFLTRNARPIVLDEEPRWERTHADDDLRPPVLHCVPEEVFQNPL